MGTIKRVYYINTGKVQGLCSKNYFGTLSLVCIKFSALLIRQTLRKMLHWNQTTWVRVRRWFIRRLIGIEAVLKPVMSQAASERFKAMQHVVKCFRKCWLCILCFLFFPEGKWADPGGTAIPGQPVARAEQAPAFSPVLKNQFNIKVLQWRTYQILSW